MAILEQEEAISTERPNLCGCPNLNAPPKWRPTPGFSNMVSKRYDPPRSRSLRRDLNRHPSREPLCLMLPSDGTGVLSAALDDQKGNTDSIAAAPTGPLAAAVGKSQA